MALLVEERGYAPAAMVFVGAERVLAWWSGFRFELHTDDRIYHEQSEFGHRSQVSYKIAKSRELRQSFAATRLTSFIRRALREAHRRRPDAGGDTRPFLRPTDRRAK